MGLRWRRKGLLVVLRVVVLLPAAIFAGLWWLSGRVLLPPVNCTAEHHVYCQTPAELGLPFEAVTLRTVDGVELPAWFIPAPGSEKGIVLIHGHGGTRNEGLRYARALHEAGFNLLALDLRRNHGHYASMGYHERKDVAAAVTFLLQRKQLQSVGVMGFSMGAATAILAMEEDPRIRAGLFSSPYASAVDELADVAARDYGLPREPLLPLFVALLDWRADMRLEEVVPEQRIGRLAPRPVLIFHCETDRTTDSSHSRRLYAQAGEPKGLWIAPCRQHERLWNAAPQEAEQRSVAFFRAAL